MLNKLQKWLYYLEKHYQYIHGGTIDRLPYLHAAAKKLN